MGQLNGFFRTQPRKKIKISKRPNYIIVHSMDKLASMIIPDNLHIKYIGDPF